MSRRPQQSSGKGWKECPTRAGLGLWACLELEKRRLRGGLIALYSFLRKEKKQVLSFFSLGSVIGHAGTVQSCTMEGLDVTLGSISLSHG